MTDAAFIGGPWHGREVALERTPLTLEVAGVKPTTHLRDTPSPEEPPVSMMERHRYEKLTDPDTGEYLGGYIYTGGRP